MSCCSSTTCESATRSRHAVGRHNMRARTSTDPQADPRHRVSTASVKSASSRSLSIVAAGVSWLLLACARRRRAAFLSGATFFARDLQSGLGLTRLQSRLHQRVAWHAMPRHGASLRGALALFFGKAKRCPGELPNWRCNVSSTLEPLHSPVRVSSVSRYMLSVVDYWLLLIRLISLLDAPVKR